MSEIKVLIVEDEPLIAYDIESIINNIDFKVAATAYSYNDAIEALSTHKPDIVLLDVNLSDEKDGIDIANIINMQYKIPFVYLTSYADKSTLDKAKKTRPSGYIVKPFEERDILAGLEIALYNFYEKENNETLVFEYINKHLQLPFSDREFDVLNALYEGKTNQQMAEELFVSVNTIKTHISNIFFKLDANSRTAAIAKVRSFLKN